MFPGGIQTPSGATPQYSLKSLPRRVESISPVGSLSPVDSGSLSPTEYERSPGFSQRLFPHQDITGLSSANYHGKIVPAKSSYPQRSSSNLLTELNNGIPSGVIINLSKVPLCPHRVHSPQSNLFAKFIPQWSHLLLPVFLQPSPPVETKSSTLQHQPRI